VQVAYDHPLSIKFLSFSLSSRKKRAWSQFSIKNSMFPIQKTASFLFVSQNRKVLWPEKGAPSHPSTHSHDVNMASHHLLNTVVCQDLDTVEAMWINYLPDYLLLKTYSPRAKCLHSFYLEVVSRIRVKQTGSRRLINYLTLLFWVLLWSIVLQSFFKTRPKPTYNLFFSFTTWLVFHDIKNTTLRRKVTSFYFSSR